MADCIVLRIADIIRPMGVVKFLIACYLSDFLNVCFLNCLHISLFVKNIVIFALSKKFHYSFLGSGN